jgi:inhibitor of KinA
MRIEPLGDSAWLIRLTAEFDPEVTLDTVVRAGRQIAAAAIPGLLELAPAYTTIAVFFDPTLVEDFESVPGKIEAALQAEPPSTGARVAREIEIPVCYDEEFALDIGDVASRAGLPVEEVIRIHAGQDYRVACVGFSPGFPYLSGLPPELATPRRASPRKEIPAGAVAIGGTQTGIYPRKSPGGWNVIGRTPARLFDVEREPPALFQAGDRVHFRGISRQEFEQMSR